MLGTMPVSHTHVWQIYDGPYPKPGWSHTDIHRTSVITHKGDIKVSCGDKDCLEVQERTITVYGMFTARKVLRWLAEINAEEVTRANQTPLYKLLKDTGGK